MNNIKRVSLVFLTLFRLIFVLIPFMQVISWLHAPKPMILFNTLHIDTIPKAYFSQVYQYANYISGKEKFLCFLISCIPTLIAMSCVYFTIKLFELYSKGEVFALNNVRYIRNIAYTLLLAQIIKPFYEFAIGIVLTWNNPPGHRYALATLDQTNFGVMMLALMILLISWIMAEGCKLREEQQLTI